MSSSLPPRDPELLSLVDMLQRRRPGRARGRPMGLSREQVVRAAIEVADAEGPEAISMRRIAAHLGTGTMTLYGYVANRDALLAAMLDEVMGEVELPDRPSGDWRSDLDLLARSFRAICRRHGWLPPQLGTSPYLVAPRTLRAVEFCLAALEPFGMDVRQAGGVLRLLNNYVIGVTLREATESAGTAQREDSAAYEAAVAAYLRQVVASGRYPAFSKLAGIILQGHDLDQDESFDIGLRCLLDGIGAQLNQLTKDEKRKPD